MSRDLKDYYERVAYRAAKYRCTNPTLSDWPNYGGRGIKFKFNSFEEFFAEVGPKPSPEHSLNRINNDGHYEKGNVAWATKSEQSKNRRPVKRGPSWKTLENASPRSLGIDGIMTKEEVVAEIKAKIGGQSLAKFAKYLGISRPFLSQILSGQRTPGISALKKLGLEKVVFYGRIE